MHRTVRQISSDFPVELESQIILRLPQAPAQNLRQAIRDGDNSLKDRLFISMDAQLRRGTVRFDNWYLPAKILDLPTISESYKTIDKRTFYKTADLCQMMLCKEDEDNSEEELSSKKRTDSFKVDKKYLYPHGITPPLKNVRKRRFRRATRKKFVEAPEIEKEVKRLLRMDNEAVQVRHDVSSEEQADGSAASATAAIKEELGVHDIFGEELSDSDDENDMNLSRPDENDMFIGKLSPEDSNHGFRPDGEILQGTAHDASTLSPSVKHEVAETGGDSCDSVVTSEAARALEHACTNFSGVVVKEEVELDGEMDINSSELSM